MLYHRFIVYPWGKSEMLLTQLLAMQTEIQYIGSATPPALVLTYCRADTASPDPKALWWNMAQRHTGIFVGSTPILAQQTLS